ncbi:hypothetical protein [Mycobacterium sp. NPDC050041]|uniref:hypothetical protein n=1 Tax=Mycobacterium sp. NPDC050041 TaxID=3364293 RepID=UPI003C2CC240
MSAAITEAEIAEGNAAVSRAESFIGPDLFVRRRIDEIGKLWSESSSSAARQ